jgi:hypothetical protein
MVILSLTLVGLIACGALWFGRVGLLRLARFPLHNSILAASGCAVQMLGFSFPPSRFAMLVLSAVLLLLFCWQNRRHAGMALIASGIALNMTVMLANGAVMPINPAALRQMSGVDVPAYTLIDGSKDQVLPDDAANLAWLGDRLLLPGPLSALAVWSIGDVVLILGIGRLLWYMMRGEHDDNLAYGSAATPSRT